MANMEMVELEIRNFIKDSDNLDSQDQFKHLMAIFSKHLAMEKSAHIIDVSDVRMIVDQAKMDYVDVKLPMKISKKELYPTEVSHVVLMEAFIMHLNKFGTLKKIVKFDYT